MSVATTLYIVFIVRNVPFLIGGALLYSFLWMVAVDFISLDANFTILSKMKVCEQPLNNRCRDEYVVQTEKNEIIKYIPLGYEFNPGEIDIGNRLKKSRYSIYYEINGELERWPYIYDVSFRIIIAFALISFGVFAYKKIDIKTLIDRYRRE